MVEFKELYIYEGKVVIDVQVKELSYLEDVYIDKILIDTQDTYSPSGPSESPVYSYIANDYSLIDSNTNLDVEFQGVLPTEQEIDAGRKRVRLVLPNKSLIGNLLYVYVIAGGTPSIDTPCGGDNRTTMSVVYDVSRIAKDSIGLIKKTSDRCKTSDRSEFIDFIINYMRFITAIDSGNYIEANKLHSGASPNIDAPTYSPCNCGK